jgi:hypothetical protein
MIVVPFLASLLLQVNTASATKPQMTYQEAATAAETQAQDPAVAGWAQEALAPLFDKEYKALLESCFKSVSETEPTSARIVVILGPDGVAITSDPEGSELFTNCIANGLRSWNWPSPPKGAIYIPLTLNIRPPDPADANKAADEIIRDLSPSNKSLERTRER